jgi:Fe-S cluster assembly ATPase SufC
MSEYYYGDKFDMDSDGWSEEERQAQLSSERRQEELLEELYQLNQEYKIMCDLDTQYDIDEMREIERRIRTVQMDLEEMKVRF